MPGGLAPAGSIGIEGLHVGEDRHEHAHPAGTPGEVARYQQKYKLAVGCEPVSSEAVDRGDSGQSAGGGRASHETEVLLQRLAADAHREQRDHQAENHHVGAYYSALQIELEGRPYAKEASDQQQASV